MTSNENTLGARKSITARTPASLQDAIDDLHVVSSLFNGTNPLNMVAIQERILDLERRRCIPISNTLKLLLSTNGSVTQALQSIQPTLETKVRIRSMNQVIMGLSGEHVDDSVYRALDIPRGASFNFRKVVLCTRDVNYLFAISLTPLCRLTRAFQDDLLRADAPIGFLLEKYKLQVLRRMDNIDAIVAGDDFAGLFGIPATALVPYRIYSIEYTGNVLMKIIEFFNPGIA